MTAADLAFRVLFLALAVVVIAALAATYGPLVVDALSPLTEALS